MSGRWRGVPSNVDWCEPNYTFSPWVAEWWNTWSSVPIALVGLWALVVALGPTWRKEPRFAVGAAALTAVGVGSFAFHGTLLRAAQAADELPMIFTGLAYLYVLACRERSRPRLAWGLAIYAAAFCFVYVFLIDWFLPFILSYAALVAYLVFESARLSFFVAREPTRMRRLALAAGAYVGGVGLLWIPEHVLLSCEHPAQAAQLHAWFHLTSALGSGAWLWWAAHDRALLRAQNENAQPAPRSTENSALPESAASVGE